MAVSFSEETLSILALSAAGLAAVSIVGWVALAGRVNRLRRASFHGERGASDDGARATDLSGEVRALREDVDALGGALADAIRRIGMVRFDAFEEMGGRLSFSAALLSEEGNGLVLTTINGRTESRIYAKPIERGASRHDLSEEEQEAIRRALQRR